MSTAADATKPQVLTKYQDGLTSASATNMARFPALDRMTGAKINRFVFRKNAPDTAALSGATVTPAGGRDTALDK
jgi:shikimate kinase